MPKVTIDGKEITVNPGTTVIVAAKQLGITIPHYCWHEKLSIAGNCRMCLVEVVGQPKPLIACNTQATDGMVVKTTSEMAVQARQGVMEFLLVNHPLDCPICDQCGECKLQDYAFEHGQGYSRFIEEKVHKPKRVPVGPRVMLDAERCILCSRCIRFCDEITKTSELGFLQRGNHVEIGTSPGRQLDNNYSMNTIDLCPVGALTNRDYRFKSRVWEMAQTASICPGCSTGCNITVWHRHGQIMRLTPRINDTVNEHWMCDTGRLGYKYVHAATRLATPLVKSGAAQRPTAWRNALRQAAELLKGAKAAALAGLAGPFATNEELYLFRKLLTQVLGGKRLDCRPRDKGPESADGFLYKADKSPNYRGARELGCVAAGKEGWESILAGIEAGEISVLYVLHEDPVGEFGESDRIRAALGKLQGLLVQDILPTATTQLAHLVLAGSAFPERDGSFTNDGGRVQRLHRAFHPPGDARADWRILRDLAQQLGAEWAYDSPADIMQEIAVEVPAYVKAVYAELGSLGVALQA
ncbi:MAG: (2Fe-2S)-binding protein [Candidatus Tectomicrobia bacterium]|nr:(2Fe-2S)-binding protein [Candidatus Tectomicrobia bacterium]